MMSRGRGTATSYRVLMHVHLYTEYLLKWCGYLEEAGSEAEIKVEEAYVDGVVLSIELGAEY
jgi:hypothetical protein